MKYFGQAKINNSDKMSADLASRSSRHSITEDNTQLLKDLTDEQLAVIKELEKGNSVVVDSVCGAGKTRVLQAVCDYFPHTRILYLTYNRLLKFDAQKKIHNSNTTVQNYHGFVYKYLMRRDIKVPPDKQIKTFLEKCSDIPIIYDIVMIDEAQDLEEDTVSLLLHIAKECPRAQWVFVGDAYQKIYDKTKVDVYADCIDKIIPNYVPLSFTKSFRISQQHAEFLSSLWGKEIHGVNPNCQVTMTTDFSELLDILDKHQNKDMLILGPRYGFTQELVNLLERHNPNKYNKQTMWTSIRDRDEGFQIQPDSLIVTTYDGCKGMERPICIVIDWTDTHFRNRVEKPFVDQTIIRNLFCVAASRGKDKIIFYRDPTKKDHLLQQKDLTLSYTQVLPTFEPSQMFSFKHPADILTCMKNVKIEDVPTEDKTVIEALRSDANIDLAPVVGVYQEIAFFEKYNFERKLDSLEQKPILTRIRKWIKEQSKLTNEQKALALTAYSTELFRYCNQANQKFISDEMHDKLLARMSSRLDPKTKKIQVGCHIVSEFTAQGFIDYVDSSNIPWELKFVGTLNNEHYLQAAMYSLMIKSPYAYLWNTRTNELKKVSVLNKEQFLSDVYTCITMGRKLRRS